MRMSRGEGINVSVDSAAFEAAYAPAMAGGGGAAAEAALGKAGDELLQAEDAEDRPTAPGGRRERAEE